MPYRFEYNTYPEDISEVKMLLGSPEQYQLIKIIEMLPNLSEEELKENKKNGTEVDREYEILLKVVNNKDNSITSYKMTREQLSEYIDILKVILVQTKNK